MEFTASHPHGHEMTDGTSHTLLRTIAELFRDGPPNGWLLGWDVDRFANQVSELSGDGEFENVTSFDYSFCNSFEVTFRQTSDEFVVLTVRVSFVADYFSMHWTQYSSSGKHGVVVDDVDFDGAARVAQDIRAFLRSMGYQEFPTSWDSIAVPEAVLELSEEPATLSKCLFDDYA